MKKNTFIPLFFTMCFFCITPFNSNASLKPSPSFMSFDSISSAFGSSYNDDTSSTDIKDSDFISMLLPLANGKKIDDFMFEDSNSSYDDDFISLSSDSVCGSEPCSTKFNTIKRSPFKTAKTDPILSYNSNIDFSSDSEDLLELNETPKVFHLEEKLKIISDEFDFIRFANKVNSGNDYKGKTVVLSNNLNLENTEWPSVGTIARPFCGSFEGNNHIIKVGNSTKPLFTYTKDALIYDLKILGKAPTLIKTSINTSVLNCDCQSIFPY